MSIKIYESNPKEYWKLLDQLKSKDNSFSEDASHVPENEWYDYLKHLNEDTIIISNPAALLFFKSFIAFMISSSEIM
jgi:hypothetical protein